MTRKMILILVGILFAISAEATTCGSGSGTVLTGKDGKSFCLSPKEMNWWSAFAWCDAAGGRMFEVNQDCPITTDPPGTVWAVACPNVENLGDGWVWTANSEHDKNAATRVNIKTAAVASSCGPGGCYYKRNHAFRALCVLR